ncbi:MAG: hypothetical protein WB676_28680 [Bryobacteraceae bacterium]
MTTPQSDAGQDLTNWEVPVRQTALLIKKLGAVPSVKPPANGSDRFKLICVAYEQLGNLYRHAEEDKDFREVWRSTTVDGRNGDCLMKILHEFKTQLQSADEGYPTGLSRLTG